MGPSSSAPIPFNDKTARLPAGSGALMIGGGGSYGRPVETMSAATRAMHRRWVVGDRDSYGAATPASWSALVVTRRAAARFRRAGASGVVHDVVPGDHRSYDIPAAVAKSLYALDHASLS